MAFIIPYNFYNWKLQELFLETQPVQVSNGSLQPGGMFKGLKVNVDSYADKIQAFRGLENINAYINDDNTVNWNDLSRAIGGCDERLLSYFRTLDNGNGTIDQQAASVNGLRSHLEQTGQMYTFAAVKASLFNAAINAGIILLFSAAIQLVVKGIDNYIHANENAIKLADELKSRHASAADELEAHRKTVNELAQSYERLSKGVKKENNQYVNESLSDSLRAFYQSLESEDRIDTGKTIESRTSLVKLNMLI